VRDFQDALALEPGNAELSKLLQTARDKYLEVEGVPVEQAATDSRASTAPGSDAEKAVTMQALDVESVDSVLALLMPAAGSCELISSGELRLLPAPAPTSGFVRISVVSDDEGESDAEESAGEASASSSSAGGAFSRVAIVEDSESEEDEDEPAPPAAQKAPTAEELKDRGNDFLKAGKAREAVQAYSDSLALDPKFVAALNNRAQAHLVLKVH
jgi:hypothetical protein